MNRDNPASVLTVNPLDTPGYEFELVLSNPNPQFRKNKKEGAVRRVSFEITKEAWDLFAEARTDGMILAGHFLVTTVSGQDYEAQQESFQPHCQRLPKPAPIPSTMETTASTVDDLPSIPPAVSVPTVIIKNETPTAEKKHWSVGSLCQSAIQLCHEPEFQKYIMGSKFSLEICRKIPRYGLMDSKNRTSSILKIILDIESRKEIDTNPEAKKKFMELMRDYQK